MAISKNNKVLIFCIILLIFIIFLSIGYSAFSDQFTITNSVGIIRADVEVRVTGVTSNSTNVTNLDYNTKQITNTVTIPAGGSVTYAVTARNLGNVPVAVSGITFTSGDNTLSSLSANITNNNYVKICNNNVCTNNALKTFDITITNNGSSLSNVNLDINLIFKEVYTVTYNNSIIGEALDGGTFEYTFTNDIPYDVSLNKNFPYEYTNNTLTVQNIDDNFVVNRYYSITYVLNDSNDATQAANQPIKYLAGSNVTILDPSRPNYTFQGWYDNPGLTGNPVTSTSGKSGNLTLYAKWEANSSGGGMGTPDNPYEDTTTTTYDFDDVPANSNIIYTAIDGKPQVKSDSDGNITSFEYTDTGSGISVPSGGIDTGVLAFDGNDYTVTLTANFKLADVNTSKVNPVLDMSFSDGNGSVNGFLVIMASNYGGTAYNEAGNNIGTTNSSNRYLKFRFNKYVSGNVDSTESRDYYSKFTTNAYYDNRFATKTEPVTLTIKIYCQNSIFTSDIIFNDNIIARPKYASKNNEKKFNFATPVTDATFKLGLWHDKDGNLFTSKFDIIEFSVVKTS